MIVRVGGALVGLGAAVDRIDDAVDRVEGVGAGVAEHEVGVGSALDHVVAVVARDAVLAVTPGDVVGVAAAGYGPVEPILAQVWESGGNVFESVHGEVLRDDPDDPMRTAMREMAAVFARLERGMITARMSRGKRSKAARSGYIGGAVPYGYILSGDNLRRDRTQQERIAAMRQLRGCGESYAAIADYMNDHDYPTASSRGRWTPMTVKRILDREIHA